MGFTLTHNFMCLPAISYNSWFSPTGSQNTLEAYPCGSDHTPSPMASRTPVVAETILHSPSARLTAVAVSVRDDHTIAFLGDSKGNLHKVRARDLHRVQARDLHRVRARDLHRVRARDLHRVQRPSPAQGTG